METHRGIVVLVEDDSHTRRAMEDLLEMEGYLVLSARDGFEALARMSSLWLPTVAVLDLSMPGMDGWELIEIMKKDPVLCRVPVLVTTAHAIDEVAGATRVLHKPLDARMVTGAVEDALRLPMQMMIH